MRFGFCFAVIAAIAAAPIGASPQTSLSGSAAKTQVEPDSQALTLARQLIAEAMPGDIHEQAWVEVLRQDLQSKLPKDLTEAQRTVLAGEADRAISLALPGIRQQLPILNEAYAQAYARLFSAEDLRQILAFTMSPVGKRYVSNGSAILMDPAVQEANRKMSESVVGTFDDSAKVACQKKAAERLAAGDSDAKCPFA